MQWLPDCGGCGLVWSGVASVMNLPSVWSAVQCGQSWGEERDDGGPPGHPHRLPEGRGQAGGQAGAESPGQAESQWEQEQQPREEQRHQGPDTSLYLSQLSI